MMSPDEKLIYMANQIARNFAAQGRDVAVAATAEHIGRYWDPRMRARITALSTNEAIELDAITRAAIGIIRTKAA